MVFTDMRRYDFWPQFEIKMANVDILRWQIGPNIIGDSEEDTTLLIEMYERALHYIASFNWAPPVICVRLAFGIGGIIALFLVEFSRKIHDDDDKLWVVIGDIPTAYLVADERYDPSVAIQMYCDLMSDWEDNIRHQSHSKDVFPVDAAPTKANADQLKDRIVFIEHDILPILDNRNRSNVGS